MLTRFLSWVRVKYPTVHRTHGCFKFKIKVLQKAHEKWNLKIILVQNFWNPCIGFYDMHFHELFEDTLYIWGGYLAHRLRPVVRHISYQSTWVWILIPFWFQPPAKAHLGCNKQWLNSLTPCHQCGRTWNELQAPSFVWLASAAMGIWRSVSFSLLISDFQKLN